MRINPAQTSGAPAAMIEVDQDYASILSQVDHLNRTVFYVFSLALAVLWVLLLPIMDRISRRMSRQNRKLREAEASPRRGRASPTYRGLLVFALALAVLWVLLLPIMDRIAPHLTATAR